LAEVEATPDAAGFAEAEAATGLAAAADGDAGGALLATGADGAAEPPHAASVRASTSIDSPVARRCG
jgi:hypothetical protein